MSAYKMPCKYRRFTSLLILNLNTRWNSVVKDKPRLLYHRERPPLPILQEAECAPRPVGTDVEDRNKDMRRLTTGIRSEKCVGRRFRHCASLYFHKPR